MKHDKCFFDTNILLYLLFGDSVRADRAETIISNGGVISVQVLNEFASVASRKLVMSYSDIRETLRTIQEVFMIQPLTLETHELVLEIAE